MDYIKQLNAFELWLETNYLPGVSQLIWYKLFMLFNRCGWAEWITVDNFRLMVLADIKSETTFITNRDKLIESGLIEYHKGKKGSPNKYKMVQLYVPLEGYTIENTPKNEVNTEYNSKSSNCTPNNGVNTELKRSENDSQNGVNPADINKLKENETKPNNNEREDTPAPVQKNPVKHKHGQHGWVQLTDDEYTRLINEFGMDIVTRYVNYVDESTQINQNKNGYKDWNLVVRKAIREKWGEKTSYGNTKPLDDFRVQNNTFDVNEFFDKAVKASMKYESGG